MNNTQIKSLTIINNGEVVHRRVICLVCNEFKEELTKNVCISCIHFIIDTIIN
jgi:hypothetical protein